MLGAVAIGLSGCQFSAHWSSGSSAGPAKSAEDLFTRVAANGAADSYAQMSPTFQRTVGPEAWKAMVVAFGLPKYDHVVWDDAAAKPTGNSAKLSGTLYARGSLAAPLQIEMDRDGDNGFWKLAAIHLHRDKAVTVGDGMAGQGAPVGTPVLSGRQLGEACRALLMRSVPFEHVDCIDSLPVRAGGSSLCMGFFANRVLGVTVRINSVDPAIDDVNLNCRITDPVGPVANPTAPPPDATIHAGARATLI